MYDPLASRAMRAGAPLSALVIAGLLLAGCSSSPAAGEEATSTAAASVKVLGTGISVDDKARAALPADIRKAGAVKVATDAPYAPFEMFVSEGSKDLTGVDVELGHAIGARLGIKFDFAQQGFDGIIPAMQAGNFDVAMSAMTSSVKRMDVLTFVDYSASGTGILTRAGNPDHIKTYLDLCGKKVAVQKATSQADLVNNTWQADCKAAGKDDIQLSEYPSDSDAQLSITAGKAVASLMTKPSAGYVAKTTNGGKTFVVVEDPAAPTGYEATLNGIGVLKDKKDLATAIQTALQSLMDDGTYKKILDHYGVAGIGVPKATINGAAAG